MYMSRSASNAARSCMERRIPRRIPRSSYPTEDILNLLNKVESETGDMTLRQSLHFTPGVVNRIERQLRLGCSIVADSKLVAGGINTENSAAFPTHVECFMDDPAVVNFATQKHTTRAEIAMDRALSLPGPKLLVIGSAPTALNRLLQLHAHSPLREVCIIAAASGFANVVELKERLWESGLPCIVVRGRKGGASAAITIANALLDAAFARA